MKAISGPNNPCWEAVLGAGVADIGEKSLVAELWKAAKSEATVGGKSFFGTFYFWFPDFSTRQSRPCSTMASTYANVHRGLSRPARHTCPGTDRRRPWTRGLG